MIPNFVIWQFKREFFVLGDLFIVEVVCNNFLGSK
jgi:hypothetical protein